MNIEELKLVLETVKGVTDGALTAVVWFYVKGFMETLVGYGSLIFVALMVKRAACSGIDKISFGGKIMSACGFHGPLTASEEETIYRIIERGRG